MAWLLLGFGILVAVGVFLVVAVIALIVAMFLTGRHAPDPRGVQRPAAFAGSLALTGMLGLLVCAAWLGAIVGAEAIGPSASFCPGGLIGRSIRTSAGAPAPLAQQDDPGPPPFEPPVFSPPRFTPRPVPTFTFPETFPTSFPTSFPIPRPEPGEMEDLEELDGMEGFPVGHLGCVDTTGAIVTALPWVLVSGVAFGAGTRGFRRLLTEERSHDRA